MNQKPTILVCCHKPDTCIRQEAPYQPIQVGKALTDQDLGFLKDDTGDHISSKNKQYNELTALYWGWKNLKDTPIKGLCHYRRYFQKASSSDFIEKTLRQKDIIVVEPVIQGKSNLEIFTELVSLEDYYILLDTLLELYPDIRQAVVAYFYNSNKWIPCNMLIAKKEVYDDYCAFLFDVLGAVEQRIKPYNYSRLNRSLGYMGELLLGLYCTYKHLDCYYDGLDELHKPKTRKEAFADWKHRLRMSLSFFFKYHYKNIPPAYESLKVGLKQDGIILKNV